MNFDKYAIWLNTGLSLTWLIFPIFLVHILLGIDIFGSRTFSGAKESLARRNSLEKKRRHPNTHTSFVEFQIHGDVMVVVTVVVGGWYTYCLSWPLLPGSRGGRKDAFGMILEGIWSLNDAFRVALYLEHCQGEERWRWRKTTSVLYEASSIENAVGAPPPPTLTWCGPAHKNGEDEWMAFVLELFFSLKILWNKFFLML